MAPALMVCWTEGGAVNFLFSVLARRRRRATGSIAAGTWRRVNHLRSGYSLSLSLARSDLRRAERHLHAGGDSILAEMMELGRLCRGGQRQVRGVADRPPGVAHVGATVHHVSLFVMRCYRVG